MRQRGRQEFIWGISESGTAPASLATENSIEVLYDMIQEDYTMEVAIPYFKSRQEAAAYLQGLLDAFAAWIRARGEDPDAQMPANGLFSHAERFSSPHEAYLYLKVIVAGYAAESEKEPIQ